MAKNQTPIFKGDRVKFAAWTDVFMRGERYGEVVKTGTKYIHVKGERSGRTFRFGLETDGLENTAPPVTLNDGQRLYVIRNPYGYGCLGYDVCATWTRGYVEWIERQGRELPFQSDELAEPGTLELYAQYTAATAAIAEIYRATGARCDAQLVPELKGLEGKRVEVLDRYGERRRFIVGRSTGWIPVHLEIANARSHGGGPVTGAPFQSVQVIG